ncbi:MAG TPA: amidohydrolase [Candidatus Eisenbacteria bacterium]
MSTRLSRAASFRGFLLLAAALALLAPGEGMAAPAADLVFRGGSIHTVDDSRPEATALAVKDGRIAFVGDDAGVAAFVGRKTRVVELAGRALVPGFVDADARLLDVARLAQGVDLYATTSFADVTRKVAQAARAVPPNNWVIGWGWDEESWRDSEPIRLIDLQSVSGNRPVLLFHATDDAIIANVSALASASVPEDLPDPPGGRVARDMRGVRMGPLMGEAASLVLRALAVPSTADFQRWYGAAAESCLVRGVTLVHDGTVPVSARSALSALWANEKTRPALGLSVSLKPEPLEFDPVVSSPPGATDRVGGLSIEGVTFRLDGFVNTRGAAISHFYYDSPGNRGFLRYSPAGLVPLAEGVRKAGWRPMFEAHGDSALSIALGTLALEDPAGQTARPLVSGLELIRPDQFARLAASGAGLVMTPTPMIDGWRWMDNRIGPEAVEQAWAMAELAKGSTLALGTGAPFADGRPILAFYAAVTRQNLDGRPAGGWKAEQGLTREAALRALTIGGATLLGRDAETGSLAVGKRADLVVLSGDLMTVPEREIPALRVEMTVAGGRIVHDRAPAVRN